MTQHKITREVPWTRPSVSLTSFTGGAGDAPSGQVPTSIGSNGQVAWGSNVGTITVNGTTLVRGPFVNFANGSNTTVTVDQVGSVGSNTIRIHATGGAASFGSNSNQVSYANAPGASTDSSRADHVHLGVTSVSHSSNTYSGPVILAPGANVGITSPTAGTFTIHSSATGGGSGGVTVQDEGTPLATTGTTLNFVGAGVVASGTGATKTITIAGSGSSGTGGRGEDSSKYNPDHETPSSTPAIQAEFNGSLTPFAWGTAPATNDVSTYPGFLAIEMTTGNHWLSTAWTPGATDLTVVCKFHVARPITNSTTQPSINFGVSNATGTDPAEAMLASFFPGNMGANGVIGLYKRDGGSWSNAGVDVQSDALSGGAHDPIWLRLDRVVSGPTWNMYFSRDGRTWMRHVSQGSKSLTVGAIQFRVADQATIVHLDYIRAWAAITPKIGA